MTPPAPAVDNGQEEATPGKVTLTFTAAIGDETRTEYPDDKTAGWVVGDKISVCVTDTDNTDYKIAEFEATSATDTGMEFTGEVESGYTTIVSGVYPANSQHVFTDGAVTSVYLPDTYELGTANDGGIALPMVGAMDKNDNFVFHHICGALKITVIDIFNALTFTTAKTITGNFELTSEGRIEIPADGDGSTVTFNYGRLSTNPTVGERDYRTFYIPVPDGNLTAGATMALKTADNTVAYEKMTTSDINFQSNQIKRLPAIGPNLRNDWSVNPDLSGDHPVIHFIVPQSVDYMRLSTTQGTFQGTKDSGYHGSIAEVIEKRLRGSYNTISGPSDYTFNSKSQGQYFDDGPDKVYIMFGVTSGTPANRKFTFDYCIVNYTVPDPATPEYRAWLGDWQVTEDTETDPKTDTWTITRKETNGSYIIKGIAKRNTVEAVGIFSSDDNGLSLYSQTEIGTYKYSGTDYTVSLFVNTPSFTSKVGNLIVSLSQEDGTVTIKESNGYGLYWVNPTSNKWTSVASLKRNPISTMNRAPEQ